MQELDKALDNLIDAILATNEFEEYQQRKKNLLRQPELKDQVDEFRNRNYQLQISGMDSHQLMEAADRFEREYEEFRSNPDVNEFLSAELALIRIMQHVYSEIMDNLDFE